MSTFKSAAFVSLSKSYGNLTMCRSRRQNIVKLKITDVRNPRTLKQQMQRVRMSTLVKLCEVFDSTILLGFPKRPVRETPYNAFVRENTPAVDVDEELKVTIHYDILLCSKGKREVPSTSVKVNEENGKLIVTHQTEEFCVRGAATDMLYAVVFEKNKKQAKLFPLNTRKDAEAVSLDLPVGWNQSDLAVYVFVMSEDKRSASNSILVPIS